MATPDGLFPEATLTRLPRRTRESTEQRQPPRRRVARIVTWQRPAATGRIRRIEAYATKLGGQASKLT